MQLIQDIITHGDLTDIAFIEKTLGTKFTYRYGWKGDGTPDHRILKLSSTTFLGNPGQVSSIIFYDKSQQQKVGFVAGLTIGYPPDFIADCLDIPITNFMSFFGGDFVFLPAGEGIPSGSENQLEGSPAKNGMRIRLRIQFQFDKNVVTSVSIDERP